MQQGRRSGIIFVLVSAVVFSTAGLFTKGVDASVASVLFWRGLAAAGFTLIWLVVIGDLRQQMRNMNGPAWLATILMAMGTAAFIPAFKMTSIAHVALIYASCPLITATLAWMLLGERPGRVVLLASLCAMGGVAILMIGGLAAGQSEVSLAGDLLALIMTVMMAGALLVYRRWHATPAALPAALSSLVLLPYATLIGAPQDVAMADLPLLIAFGLVFAIASVCLSEGARRLPSAEVALLSTLETPIAPLLAWVVFAAIPSPATFVGGGVIFVAVLWSQTAHRKVVG